MHLFNTNISGQRKYRKVLAQLKSSTYDSHRIELDHCSLSDQQVAELFTALRQFPDQQTEVTRVMLSNNSLTTVDASGLSSVMILDLSHNSIKKFTASNMPYLTELYLQNNQLKTADVGHLKTLRVLDVAHNSLRTLDVAQLRFLNTLHAEQATLETIFITQAILDKALTYNPTALNPISQLLIDGHCYPDVVKKVAVSVSQTTAPKGFSLTGLLHCLTTSAPAHAAEESGLTAPVTLPVPREILFTSKPLSEYITHGLIAIAQRSDFLATATKVYAYLTAAGKLPNDIVRGLLRGYLHNDLVKSTDPLLNEILTAAYAQKAKTISDSTVEFMLKDYPDVEDKVMKHFVDMLNSNQALSKVIAKLKVDETKARQKPITVSYENKKRAHTSQRMAFRGSESSVTVKDAAYRKFW